MNRKTLTQAVAEAQRFIERAEALPDDVADYGWQMPRERGAIKRASMDLTRALAVLRRPS